MHLVSLKLRNFRNYKEETVTFDPKINLIIGENGAGKTNLLEAIYFLSTGRSFRTNLLKDMIHKDHSLFFIEATFVKDGVTQTLKVGYDETNKKIEHNATELGSFSNMLGIMPSVIFSPKDIHLISGSPQERRRFLNLHLAQSDPVYVYHLLRYTKALKQRNAFFKQKKLDGIECYEEEMALSSIYLMTERKNALSKLENLVKLKMSSLSNAQDDFKINYQPSLSGKFDNASFIKQFEKMRPKELLCKSTLVGPHRDDFHILQDNNLAKSYASEGQKRTFLSALKFSEWNLLKESTNASPIMSIDDIGMHLDQTRKNLLKDYMSSFSQVFLTVPSDPLIEEYTKCRIEIADGKIKSSTSPLSV
ncbi:MAG: DNA replication and repair protein RecF [Chlamydiia bacterium]|nr:DNA replication and repair protein RecF [Chlamydiia bacterium]